MNYVVVIFQILAIIFCCWTMYMIRQTYNNYKKLGDSFKEYLGRPHVFMSYILLVVAIIALAFSFIV